MECGEACIDWASMRIRTNEEVGPSDRLASVVGTLMCHGRQPSRVGTSKRSAVYKTVARPVMMQDKT